MNRFCASLMIVPRFVPLLPASWKEKRVSSLSVEMVWRTYIQLRVAQLFLLPEVPNLIHWVGTTSVAIGGHLWHITGHHWPVHLRLLHHWHLLRLHHHLVVAHHVVPIRRCLKLVVQFGQTFVHLEKKKRVLISFQICRVSIKRRADNRYTDRSPSFICLTSSCIRNGIIAAILVSLKEGFSCRAFMFNSLSKTSVLNPKMLLDVTGPFAVEELN